MAVPDIIAESIEAATTFADNEEDMGHFLARTVVRFCSLLELAAVPRLEHDRSANLSELLLLEAALDDLTESCPPQYIWTEAPAQKSSQAAFSDKFHIYSSNWSAVFWNHVRVVRLFINRFLVQMMRQLVESGSDQQERVVQQRQISKAEKVIEQLCLDICASVPFYLGDPVAMSLGGKQPFSPAAAGSLVLWHLYAVAHSETCSKKMRTWIAATMKNIAAETGIQQAKVIADML